MSYSSGPRRVSYRPLVCCFTAAAWLSADTVTHIGRGVAPAYLSSSNALRPSQTPQALKCPAALCSQPDSGHCFRTSCLPPPSIESDLKAKSSPTFSTQILQDSAIQFRMKPNMASPACKGGPSPSCVLAHGSPGHPPHHPTHTHPRPMRVLSSAQEALTLKILQCLPEGSHKVRKHGQGGKR